MNGRKLDALAPRKDGHQFVFYGDSCSGVPGALHEANLASVNAVVRCLEPEPEFIVFPGDEIIGLIPGEAELRGQWRHFFEVEMAWLNTAQIPMYHSTGNHTTYNKMSERVFADVMSHLPRNGPPDQLGLSYFVRKGDLLLVFVHTLWSGLGGEGHVELEWLQETLTQNGDARWTFVVGHHPAYPVNGFVGTYQRTLGAEYVSDFWRILADNSVMAYLCSHILAFDVQCHSGVLQITSAGAGTDHRMPEGIEYLHAVQMAVDKQGLRYQVLDVDGTCREKLSWPPPEPRAMKRLNHGRNANVLLHSKASDLVTCFEISGLVVGSNAKQTIIAALDSNNACPLWIGLVGRQRQLTIALQPQPGRSPHQWLGPSFRDGDTFDIEVLIHGDMGPGGFLWRTAGSCQWTGFHGASAWGAERLIWPENLCVGGMGETDPDNAFIGKLSVSMGFEKLWSHSQN